MLQSHEFTHTDDYTIVLCTVMNLHPQMTCFQLIIGCTIFYMGLHTQVWLVAHQGICVCTLSILQVGVVNHVQIKVIMHTFAKRIAHFHFSCFTKRVTMHTNWLDFCGCTIQYIYLHTTIYVIAHSGTRDYILTALWVHNSK